MLYNTSAWSTFEYEYFYLQIDPSITKNLVYRSFCCLNFIRQTIYYLMLLALCGPRFSGTWSAAFGHESQKQFPEEISFTRPAVWVGKSELKCGRSELHSVGHDPENEDGDLPRFDYSPIQFPLSVERKRLFCSGEQSQHNVNIYVHVAILQKQKLI